MRRILTFNFSVWQNFTRKSFPQLLNDSKLLVRDDKTKAIDEKQLDSFLSDLKTKQAFLDTIGNRQLNYAEFNSLVTNMIEIGIPEDYQKNIIIVFSLFCFYYDNLLKKIVDLYYENPLQKANSLVALHLSYINPNFTLKNFLDLQMCMLDLIALIHQTNPAYSLYIFRHLRRNCLFILSKSTDKLSKENILSIIVNINKMGFYSVKWTYIYLGFLKPYFYQLSTPQIEELLFNLQQYDLDYLKRLDFEKPTKYSNVKQSSLEKLRNMVSMLFVLYMEKATSVDAKRFSQILKNLNAVKLKMMTTNLVKLSDAIIKISNHEDTNFFVCMDLVFYFALIEGHSTASRAFDPVLLPFYDKMTLFFVKKPNFINSWKTIGKLLLGFSKVNYYPKVLIDTLKPRIFQIYQNKGNDDRMDKIKLKIDNLKAQVDNLSKQDKSSETTAEYFKLQEELRSEYIKLNKRTNSFIELIDIVEALAKFSQAIKDDNFINDLYDVVNMVYDDLLQDPKQLSLILQHRDNFIFILFCRNCCLLFSPTQASRIAAKTFKLISSNFAKFGELNFVHVNMLFQ